MLELDHHERITAKEALAHLYLEFYAISGDEAIAEPYDDTFGKGNRKLDEWKSIIYNEIMNSRSLTG
ncbi:mitogen-activated protein kinase 14B-like protein [Dinothrombium tinctorium]|uniref:Mitogen-activated protein kinase 14B-like protein n=1 Tax=Dinothrombium tinctorium TaxID=1965070 RepID=A0A3S3P144_9ACAR|nr:mitogen-activated protein kinase 14B-like protein [Dinothrombium tinctorium]